MVVTTATVGYGDITPHSDAGRFVAVCTIVIALTYIPLQINNILQVRALLELREEVSLGQGLVIV